MGEQFEAYSHLMLPLQLYYLVHISTFMFWFEGVCLFEALEESSFFAVTAPVSLLYVDVVSELSSSGLLLSSVSFPLLPKLHPPLSLSEVILTVLGCDDDEVAEALALFISMSFFSLTNFCFSLAKVVFTIVVRFVFSGNWLLTSIPINLSPPFLDNDELDDEDNEDEAEEDPRLAVNNG